MSYYLRYAYTENDGRQVDGIALVPEEMDTETAEKLFKEGKASKLSEKESKELMEKESKIKEDDWDADEP